MVEEKIIEIKAQVSNQQSVKELKEQIRELTYEMETLDKESLDYQKTVDALVDAENELNKAMKVGKSQLSAQDGSYNALSNRMSALKKAQKAVTDEFTRSRLAEEINKINNELKAIDANNGVYVRNVGDYENAIKRALKTPQQELKELRVQLAQLVEGTTEYNIVFNRMAELTHTVTEQQEMLKWSSSDLGDMLGNLAGVATSLAGGFSALNALGGLFGGDDNEEVEKAMLQAQRFIQLIQGLEQAEQLADKVKGLWVGIQQYAKLGKANEQAEEFAEVANSIGENAEIATETLEASTVATNAQSNANTTASVTTNLFSKSLAGLKTALISTGIGALLVGLGYLLTYLMDGVSYLWKWASGAKSAEERTNQFKTEVEDLNEALEISNKNWDKNEQLLRAQGKTEEEIYNKKKSFLNTQLAQTKALLDEKEAIYNSMSEREKGKKKNEEFIKTLEELREQYKDLKTDIDDLDWDEYCRGVEEAKKAEEERAKKLKEQRAEAKKKYEDEKKIALDLFKTIQDNNKTELEKLEEKYKKEYDQLNKFGLDTTLLTEQFENKKKQIIEKAEEEATKKIEKEKEEQRKAFVEASDAKVKAIEKEIDKLNELLEYETTVSQQEYATYLSKANIFNTFTNNSITQMKKRWEIENEIFNNKKTILEKEIEMYKVASEDETLTDEDRLNAKKKLAELERQLELENADYQIAQNNRKKEAIENYTEAVESSLDNIGQILQTVADAWEQSIQSQIDSGQISEEEGEKQMDNIRGIQSAIALMNALSSAVSAYNSTAQIPFVGAYLAPIASATALASGLMQVKAINSVKKGDTTTNAPQYASVTPQSSDYTPTMYQNITGLTEQSDLVNALTKSPIKAYVVENEITTTQNRVAKRNEETSF